MRRRDTLLVLASLAAPATARAQRRPARPLLAWLNANPRAASATLIDAFLAGMAELGYVDGRSIDYAFRYGDGGVARLPALAEELLALNPGVFLAGAVVGAVVLRQKTTTIPIVCPALADAEHLGLVASVAHPGGNVTGITPYVAHLPSKQMELALELVPRARHVGLLGNLNDPKAPPQAEELQAAARVHEIRVSVPELRGPADVLPAIARLAQDGAEVVIVLQTSMTYGERTHIAEAAAAHRLPMVYGYREHVSAGGLVSYGVDLRWCFRRGASYVHRILGGTPAGELPVEFPSQLVLVVNAGAARRLGLEIPVALLGRADEIID